MLFISILPPLSTYVEAIFDSTLLIILIFPILYIFLFRPLTLHITQRKRTEVALMESEERLGLLFESTEDIIVIQDVEGRYLHYNASSLFGLKAGDAIGKTAFDFFDRETASKMMERVRRVAESGQSLTDESKVTWKGETLWFSDHVFPLKDASGRVTSVVTISRNITKIKRAEEAIMQSKLDWESTFDSINDIITIHDKDFNIIRANKTAKENLGLRSLETVLAKCYKHFHGKDHLPEGCLSCETPKTGKPSTAEMFEPHLNMFIEVRAIPRFDTNNQLSGVVHVVRDITERKMSEEALRESEEKLRNAQKMEAIGSLVAGVAHEVRNPLNSIMAVTDALLKYHGENQEFKQLFFHIRSQVNRLSELMRDLLELGKPIEPLNMQRIDLAETCSAAVALWNQSSPYKTHKVRVMKPSDAGPIEVIAESQRLKQVILNLLENASQHSPEGSEIRLVIQKPLAGKCKVRVVDLGPGVPEEFLPRVFQPFFSTRRGGTGLGLSIIKNIVESYGGSVLILNDDPPPGCVVEVTLPLAENGKP
jgi:PAS domain S-box-containing protein